MDATSPFLNKPLRTHQQASADIARSGLEQAKAERLCRLHEHGASFSRIILDGAFERVYEADGSYRLQPVGQDPLQPPSGPGATETAPAAVPRPAPSPAVPPQDQVAVHQSGYYDALRDISCWVAVVALRPRMDCTTLAALNREIERLSHRRGATDRLTDSRRPRHMTAADKQE